VITSARSSEQPQVDNSNFEEISDEFEEEAPLQALPRKYINDMVKDVKMYSIISMELDMTPLLNHLKSVIQNYLF
jgi:hypothetical protein